MGKKSIYEYENIFVDTGVIIDLLKTDVAKSTDLVKKRIKLVNKFFTALKLKKNKVIFTISSLNIAEIFHVDAMHDDSLTAIINLFDSQNVVVISFEEDTALYHNSEFHHILGNKEIDKIKTECGYEGSQYCNTRERIRKDVLLVATAKMQKADLILTNDNGFKTLCIKQGLFCYCFTDKEDDFIMSGGGNKLIDFKF